MGVVQVEGLEQVRGNTLNRYAQPATRDAAFVAQLHEHFFGKIDGSGKTDALATRDNGGINANHLAAHIEQGTTTVARIDRGIGLDEIVIGTSTNNSSLGTDNARRDGMT